MSDQGDQIDTREQEILKTIAKWVRTEPVHVAALFASLRVPQRYWDDLWPVMQSDLVPSTPAGVARFVSEQLDLLKLRQERARRMGDQPLPGVT